jgi:hypothetical protein
MMLTPLIAGFLVLFGFAAGFYLGARGGRWSGFDEAIAMLNKLRRESQGNPDEHQNTLTDGIMELTRLQKHGPDTDPVE